MPLNDIDDVVRVLENIKDIQESAHGYSFRDGPIVDLLNRISSQLDDTNDKLDQIIDFQSGIALSSSAIESSTHSIDMNTT